MENTKLIYKDFFVEIFESDFEYSGKKIPVRFYKNTLNGEIKINADDVFKCLGYDSVHDFFSTDNGLDFISEFKKKNPNVLLFGEVGSGAMFEKINF